MKKLVNLFIVVGLLLVSKVGFSQAASSFRINEVLVTNTDDYQDDFGKHHAWVELFNSSYGTADLGGCYLTDDMNNPKKYFIPKGDVLTKIKPRQHVIFWIDNMPVRGTFHVNFSFDSTKSNFIALFDANGRTLIDSMTIPALKANESFGLPEDGVRFVTENKALKDKACVLEKTTPSTNNFLRNQGEANDRLTQNDPTGVGMTITAMSVVFIALVLLYVVFRLIGRYSVRRSRRNALIAQGLPVDKASEKIAVPGEASGEVYAAIAMALYLYQKESGVHDVESTILTIDRVTRNYSPWSSKIYTLRQTPTVNKK